MLSFIVDACIMTRNTSLTICPSVDETPSGLLDDSGEGYTAEHGPCMSLNSLRFFGLVLAAGLMLTGCSSASAPARSAADDPASRGALKVCATPGETSCRVPLFSNPVAIASRDPRYFPVRYLELWNADVRRAECLRLSKPGGNATESFDECEIRLAALADYLNPGGQPPDIREIGVALEGGGSKAAPFALGVLAGLVQEGLLPGQVTTVSSVSGGSYAASFLFNRLLDRAAGGADHGDYDAWFASCIPHAYLPRTALGQPNAVQTLANLFPSEPVACPEIPVGCGEDEKRDPAPGSPNAFAPPYRFQGQVWTHPDVLFRNSMSGLRKAEGSFVREFAATTALVAETAVAFPAHHVAHSLFRWPTNMSPSRAAYARGLERQFGYSPSDWFNTPGGARHDRVLSSLANISSDPRRAPRWIIGTSSPGFVGPNAWLKTQPRDPLRHQFELTSTGYGSGIYGYAKRPPRLSAKCPACGIDQERDMSIIEAVLASAAFFDDQQSLLSEQPLRFVLGALMHIGNVSWAMQIPNFNVPDQTRMRFVATPFPFYSIPEATDDKTPFIHLTDGGNAENTGIYALLRRGYRTIVYAHGTEDREARLAALCHIKNQLEIEGTYRLVSPDLDAIAERAFRITDPHRVARPNPFGTRPDVPRQGRFRSYFDQLCTDELGPDDFVAYGSSTGRMNPLARLLCRRLGYAADLQTPCIEYFDRFPKNVGDSHRRIRPTYEDTEDLFFRWSGARFQVLVFGPESAVVPLSTIKVVLPAVSRTELASQVSNTPLESWAEFCNDAILPRPQARIDTCTGPDGATYSRAGQTSPSDSPTAIPCTSATFLLINSCKSGHPKFPQHSFISQTWNSSYTMFAAYFDLGRNQVRRLFDLRLDQLVPVVDPDSRAASDRGSD